MGFSHVKKFLVGDPLSTDRLLHEKIPKWKALAVLSSDALSSVAYATEEVLIPLAGFSSAALIWSLPVALLIGLLIFIITVSYRQTITAYPNGGGAYTVAKENLGKNAGLVAGASLLIDYILTVAVSTAAGVENITSAFPMLYAWREVIAISFILILAIFNLRGVKESATIFALPTYFFIISFFVLIFAGFYQWATGAIPNPPPLMHDTYPTIPLFLFLRAFSGGCSALTGIEAITNGIPLFKEPAQKNAKITMAWMSLILGSLFLGITTLAHLYGIQPHESETTVSVLAKSIFGENLFYYVVQIATALILILAANTAYADFPRLSSLLANDRYLPRQLASLGDRLVYSNGIIGLSLAAALLIIGFKGETHLLIPLYAIGVFVSFTLSQAGMVKHHLSYREEHWKKGIAFNFTGMCATAVVCTVISITKFTGGAWMVIIFIPFLIFVFKQIHVHYVMTARKLSQKSLQFKDVPSIKSNVAVLPVSGLHPGVYRAIQYARTISQDIRVCCVEIEPTVTKKLEADWHHEFPDLKLYVIPSPYRSVMTPIVDFIDQVQKQEPASIITVVIPEFVTGHWYHSFLHNQTALLLGTILRWKRDLVIIHVRYHLDD